MSLFGPDPGAQLHLGEAAPYPHPAPPAPARPQEPAAAEFVRRELLAEFQEWEAGSTEETGHAPPAAERRRIWERFGGSGDPPAAPWSAAPAKPAKHGWEAAYREIIGIGNDRSLTTHELTRAAIEGGKGSKPYKALVMLHASRLVADDPRRWGSIRRSGEPSASQHASGPALRRAATYQADAAMTREAERAEHAERMSAVTRAAQAKEQAAKAQRVPNETKRAAAAYAAWTGAAPTRQMRDSLEGWELSYTENTGRAPTHAERLEYWARMGGDASTLPGGRSKGPKRTTKFQRAYAATAARLDREEAEFRRQLAEKAGK